MRKITLAGSAQLYIATETGRVCCHLGFVYVFHCTAFACMPPCLFWARRGYNPVKPQPPYNRYDVSTCHPIAPMGVRVRILTIHVGATSISSSTDGSSGANPYNPRWGNLDLELRNDLDCRLAIRKVAGSSLRSHKCVNKARKNYAARKRLK